MAIQQSVGGFLTPYAYESITVDATAGGVGLTASKIEPTASVDARLLGVARLVVVTTEDGSLRMTADGTAPVAATTGHLITPGSVLEFANLQTMRNVRFIRETGTSAHLKVTYYR